MLKYFSLGALVLLLSVSCETDTKQHYDDEKLVDVLKDMLIAEGAATRVNKNKRDSLNTYYYGQIYQIHEVDSALFANDLEILGNDPAHSIAIYKKIEDEIDADEVEAKRLQEIEKKRTKKKKPSSIKS